MDKLKIIFGSLIIVNLLDACSFMSYKKTQPEYYQKYLYEFPDEAYLDQGLIGIWYNETVSGNKYNYSVSKSSATNSMRMNSEVQFKNNEYTGSKTRRRSSGGRTRDRDFTGSEIRGTDSKVRTNRRELTGSKTRGSDSEVRTKNRKTAGFKTRKIESEVSGRCVVLNGSGSGSMDSRVHSKYIEFMTDGQVIYTPNLGNPNSEEYWGHYKTLYDTLYCQFNIGKNFSESLEVFVFALNGSSVYFRRVEKYGTTNRILNISLKPFESYTPYY